MNRVTNQDIETHLAALQAGIQRLKRHLSASPPLPLSPAPLPPLDYTLLIDGERLSQSLTYFEAMQWRDTLAGSHPGAVIVVVIIQEK